MDSFRLAVKAFIVNKNGRLLIIRRRLGDVHKPGIWELPGGRLKLGEDPFIGIKREIMEETGIAIEVMNPINIRHFIREDKQKITMIIFLSKPISDKVNMGKEHIDYDWIELSKARNKINEFFYPELDIFERYFSHLMAKI